MVEWLFIGSQVILVGLSCPSGIIVVLGWLRRSRRCPCPGIGGLREAGKPVLHRGSGSLLYGEYICFTKDMRVRSVYGTLSILYVLSYKWQDMVKIFGVKVPPCADLLARQAAHCGKISPSVHRVHLHKMSAM